MPAGILVRATVSSIQPSLAKIHVMADTRKKVVNVIKEDGKRENTDGDFYLAFVLAMHRALARLVPGASQNQAVSAGHCLRHTGT